MQLTILGAAHEVTGSCMLLEACGRRILIDCGLEQGPDEYENQELPQDPSAIDAVLLTHAHIDHSGKLPLLYARGFRGKIHATGATGELCGIMLRDSAHIQMFEAEWRNRKAKRAGREEFVPLYDMEDAEGAIGCFEGHDYGAEFTLFEGIQVRFVDAGHLLGSASIEVLIGENGTKRRIVFSGDIGNLNQPLVRDPQYIGEADYVVMESTYGTRLHDTPPDYVAQLARIIQETFDRGGNVVIPSFAVGRTQEMLYFLRQIEADRLVTGHGAFPVWVDSPLAIDATSIFENDKSAYFDAEALALMRQGINPIHFPSLHLSVSSDESRAINADPTPKVILSASGMCEAGRIKHHLKHNLWLPQSTILFVGYQAQGTLGRALLEGAKKVKLFGEEIEVKAQIRRLDGVSGHADRDGLLRWIGAFSEPPRRVFVVHGSDEAVTAFAGLLSAGDTPGGRVYDAVAPYPGARFDLLDGQCLDEGARDRPRRTPEERARASEPYARLLAAARRLGTVARRNEGGANKDLARFADQILALCEKWDR